MTRISLIAAVLTRDLRALRREIEAYPTDAELWLVEPTGQALAHLVTHCAYHVGQIDYHRRLITGQTTTVGAMAPGELIKG